MNSLAMDTATETLALALRTDGGTRILTLQVGLKHSEGLMPAVDRLLAEGQIDPRELGVIICSLGPGSFTGIRIGLATAKGLAFGLERSATGCALIGVSTLDALAHRYRSFTGAVVAVNPSLRKKHYAAVYQEGKRSGDYLETTLPDLAEHLCPYRSLLLTGAAARALHARLRDSRPSEQIVLDEAGNSTDAIGLLECGLAELQSQRARGQSPQEPVPLYLRKSEAEIRTYGE